MHFENYRDFYQKALLPIGFSDRSELTKTDFNDDLTVGATHWLIALDGELAANSKEFYHWKVKIYPSNSEGTFSWNKPYYSSSAMDSFDHAIELARSFESYSKNDQMFSIKFQNTIN
jgi:hypothetical protein